MGFCTHEWKGKRKEHVFKCTRELGHARENMQAYGYGLGIKLANLKCEFKTWSSAVIRVICLCICRHEIFTFVPIISRPFCCPKYLFMYLQLVSVFLPNFTGLSSMFFLSVLGLKKFFLIFGIKHYTVYHSQGWRKNTGNSSTLQ